MNLHVQPGARGRATAALVAVGGAAATHDWVSLLSLWVAAASLMAVEKELRSHARFLITLWMPLAAGLAVVWGLIVRAAPGTPPGSSMSGGLEFAALVSLRLAVLAALFQAVFLALRGLRLAAFLTRLGCSPEAVAGAVSIFQLWPDFSRRADEVVAARCARGLMTDRRFLTRIRQLPFTFRTLFLSSLGESLDRAARWQRERLPQRLVAMALAGNGDGTLQGSVLWVATSAVWCLWALRGFIFSSTT